MAMDNKKEIIDPIFIVSSGRSGTTLLRGILNASEQIYIPHESDFLARAYPFFYAKNISKDDYEYIVRLFIKSSQNKGWGMDFNYIKNSLESDAPTSFSGVNESIYRAYLNKLKLSELQWGIKHPVLIASIGKILKVFPSAKVIHIVRDGRDVSLSYQKVHQTAPQKFGPKGPVSSSLYWIDGLRRVSQHKTDQVYEIRYEDLLNQPAQEIEKLCHFIGISWDKDLYENYQSSKNNKKLLLDQHKDTIHAKVKQGIDATNQHKFMLDMPKLHRFLFELIAFPYLSKYGYPIEFSILKNPALNLFRALLYWAARLFNDIRYSKRDYKRYRAVQ